MEKAIFMMLAAHYIFNIEYRSSVKDVFYFLQEKVLGFPDPHVKRSSMYNIHNIYIIYLLIQPLIYIYKVFSCMQPPFFVGFIIMCSRIILCMYTFMLGT